MIAPNWDNAVSIKDPKGINSTVLRWLLETIGDSKRDWDLSHIYSEHGAVVLFRTSHQATMFRMRWSSLCS